MLGNLTNRVLLMILGYAYPAYECYKTIEKNKVEIEDLRFWCQFWIIVAFLTVLERVGDIFISWLPFYGEAKVAVFVYLWYPSVKGTSHVYGTMVRPQLVKHEPAIDKKVMEVRERAWDYIMQHWHKVFAMGQATFFQLLTSVSTQTAKVSNRTSKARSPKAAAPPSPGKAPSRRSGMSTPSKSKLGSKVDSDSDESDTGNTPKPGQSDSDLSDRLQARLKLRRQQSDM